MQWRRQRRVIHVIGSSNHVLLLARYQDAPPGEKDEEEGLRNGFMDGKEHDTSTHSFSRNAQSGYKPRKSGNSDGSAYAGNSDEHKNESFGSPSQPKIIFNEDEYTRITTPRQDMLFKKGYLSRKKPWVGNVNTSATSSTTESQSASHSTAGRDGSETTEDQQLLDRDYAIGEYAPMMDSSAQLDYGTFYDHVGGYYYEYPVMLVGPAPIPAQVAPSVLAAVPCAPVPLRPMQWVNSSFVPKIPNNPYCMLSYEGNQGMENTVMMEEQENATVAVENSNGACNKSGTGSTSCSGSVAGETEEQPIEFGNTTEELQVDEQMEEQMEEQYENEQQAEEQCLENGIDGGPYFEPMLLQQPVHVSHVIPAVPQPYMYPGHYMFGPPFIDVNGVTIQGGPMIRTMDVAAMSAAYAKRRRKKKRRKQILQARFATGNTEDEEEGEYSSEYDTGLSLPKLSWTTCSTSTTTTTTTTSNQPLNPECQEFQLRKVVKTQTSLPAIPTSANNTPTSEKSSTINQSSMDDKPPSDTTPVDESKEVYNGIVSDDSENQNDEITESSKSDKQVASTSTLIENSQSKLLEATTDNEANRLTNCLPVDEESVLLTNEVTEVGKLSSTTKAVIHNDSSTANELHERPSNEMNGKTLVNGKLDFDSSNNDTSITLTTSRPLSPVPNNEKTRSRSITPKSVENVAICEDQNYESLTSSKSSSSTSLSKRKYTAKGTKFVREPTPGPDLNSSTEVETETKVRELTQSLEKVDLSNDLKADSVFEPRADKVVKDGQVSNKFRMKTVCNRLSKEAIEATNEDSGFESQTQLSDYPITEAVTEWLRREKSPDLFIGSAISMDCEEDEDDVDKEPPKNLHGNPMPALSVNSEADNTALSCAANCGKFARISNVNGGKEQQQSKGNNSTSRRKKDAKRRLEERRRMARYALDSKVNSEVVSTSDSCDQQEDLANIARRKNPSRHQQQQDVVDDTCEFTEKDSVVGMRVALSSRIDSKRVNARRTKRQGKSHMLRNPSNNIDTKIRCSENDENDEGIVEDTIRVRTYEKGEVIFSEDGKLLMSSMFKPDLWKCYEFPTVMETLSESETVKQTTERKTEEACKRKNSVEDEECRSRVGSLDSIEEPDVLECWEAEIIEPVITPKRMLQTEGILCEGEAAEDDTIEVDPVNLEYVQKYYRLARESASIEEISLKADLPTSSKSVPNMSEQKKEIPTQKEIAGDKNDIPIDEAFEVYESCYTGNSPFLTMDSKLFKPQTLYSQKGEAPISCKAVCCQIQ
ncbi:PREDICTED: uncharacterized protein LOC108552962 isoform X1 [Eufriesea mexicana]|uniref:uncharacterized protein LOC108552962 isoform X1 n=1 Tax=Eufriesea mexicana TaxID=516756 RepID=UPI00083BF022|nr:PREDICTED: uncharacterized protein LOC108552962 isoform X1 [Eufriesea mexicana]